MTLPVRAAAIALAAISLFAVAGCGYSSRSLYPQDVQTVAVDIFARSSEVYRRNLEMRLTEAVAKRIELDTPYKLADKGSADTLLTGEIQVIGQQVLYYDTDTGLPRELKLVMLVDAQWQDLRSGDIRQKSRFRIATTYIPPDPFSEDFFQGSEDDINELAGRIVERMESEW